MTWPQVALKDFGKWYGGGTPSKSNSSFWDAGTIPWLSPKDMGANTITDTQDHITEAAVSNSSVKIVPAGSIAVVVRSGILERKLPIASVPFETTLNQDMKALAPRGDLDPRWVEWGLRAFERQLLESTRKAGTTVASLEMPRFQAFRLPLPPLAEQRRIVEILEDHLSHLDVATQYLADAERRSRGLLARHLSSAASGPLRALSEVAHIQGGVQKQPRRKPHENFYPFLRVANVTAGGLDLEDVHAVELFGKELDRLRLLKDDLLVVEGNGSPSQIGRAALWDGSIANCVHQNHLIRVRTKPSLLPAYLEVVWNAPQTRKTLTAVSSSSSGLHTLSVSKLKSLRLPIPPLSEQRRVADIVADARLSHLRVLRQIDASRWRSAQLRRALMAAAFSGKLTGRHTDQEIIQELAQ